MFPANPASRSPVICREDFPTDCLVNGSNIREVSHATGLRRTALLSRSCPNAVEATLSETHVKRGRRVVHGNKELHERLGRNDPCPCGSGKKYKKCHGIAA